MDNVRRRILTFALVRQGFLGASDPITALTPFLSPIAADYDGRSFEVSDFRSEMKSRYGIALSRDVTEIFCQRLIKLKLLRVANPYPIWVRPASAPISDGKEAAERLDEILIEAKTFYENKNDLIKEEFNEDKFLEALLAVLLDQNSALSAAVSNIHNEGHDVAGRVNRSEYEYYASEFIKWTATTRKELFEWLADLSGTALVSEALIEVRTPSGAQSITKDLTVYLDSPVAMELLGCSGTAAREDAALLVRTLKSERVAVCILNISVEELKRNISAVLNVPSGRRIGPTAKALLYQETTDVYLRSVLADPSYFLNQIGVQVVDPNLLPHLVDEMAFNEDDRRNFYAAILSLHERDEPRQHDVDVISWIMQRRKSEVSSDVLRAKHILLTRNDQLVRSASTIVTQRKGYARRQWGPAIAARELAGVLWTIVGQTERSEISQRQLILSCDRARASAPQVIASMMDTLRSVNEANAELLWVAVQKPAYMSMALDAAAMLGSGKEREAADLTLDRIKQDLVSEERSKARVKIARQKEANDAEAELAKGVIGSIKEDLNTLEKTNKELTESLHSISLRLWFDQQRKGLLMLKNARVILNIFLILIISAAAVLGTDGIAIAWQVKAVLATMAGLIGLYVTNDFIMRLVRSYVESWAQDRYGKELNALLGSTATAVKISTEMFIPK